VVGQHALEQFCGVVRRLRHGPQLRSFVKQVDLSSTLRTTLPFGKAFGGRRSVLGTAVPPQEQDN
jgi:hypothetical protein